jgi:hypothetical protein
MRLSPHHAWGFERTILTGFSNSNDAAAPHLFCYAHRTCVNARRCNSHIAAKIPEKMVNANRETRSSLRGRAGTSTEFFMFPFT